MLRGGVILAVAVLAMSGCTVSPAAAPSSTPEPPVQLEPPPSASLLVTGPEEVVFDWSAQACEPSNIPDLATRAFRDASGRVQMLLSHYTGYRMVGPDLDHLTMDCAPVWTSARDSDPAQHNDAAWIAAPYTSDGATIYAIQHNEYQGHTHPGQCPTGNYVDCLDTTLTLWLSTDAGDSYAPAVPPPTHYVAGVPEPYSPGSGPFGLRSPSNVIEGPDGALYMFANAMLQGSQKQVMCLLRTDDISDPTSWRWWNGSGFVGEFADPEIDPAGQQCAAVAPGQIGAQLTESLTFNTDLESYVLIGLSADQIDGREVWGFYVSFSRDLTTWSPRRLIAEMPLPWTVPNSGDSVSALYPSLLDPESTDRNFGTTDSTAYIYYTRHNAGQSSLDRDLVRVPVEFVLDAG